MSPPTFNRRKLATELLEALERQETHDQQDDGECFLIDLFPCGIFFPKCLFSVNNLDQIR